MIKIISAYLCILKHTSQSDVKRHTYANYPYLVITHCMTYMKCHMVNQKYVHLFCQLKI
jgi:hypothetical protein